MPSTIVTNIEMNTSQTNMKLDALNASFTKLDKSLIKVQNKLANKYVSSIRKAARSQRLFNRELRTFNTFNRNSIVNLSRAIPAYARLIKSIGAIPKAFSDANTSYDKFISTMLVSTSSVQAAAEEYGFIADEATRMGVSVSAVAQPYAKLRAALSTTGLSLKQSQDLFISFAQAGTALHLSNSDLGLSFLALQQMASKGKLSMEEIRQQLAEKIPGALDIFATAAGMSISEFEDAVKAGALDSAEILAKIPEEMNKRFKFSFELASRSFGAEIKRMGNVSGKLKEIVSKVGEIESMNNKLGRGVGTLTRWLETGTEAAEALGDSISDSLDRANVGLLKLTETDYWDTFTKGYKEAFSNFFLNVKTLFPILKDLNFTSPILVGIALLPLRFKQAAEEMRIIAERLAVDVLAIASGESARENSFKKRKFDLAKKFPRFEKLAGFEPSGRKKTGRKLNKDDKKVVARLIRDEENRNHPLFGIFAKKKQLKPLVDPNTPDKFPLKVTQDELNQRLLASRKKYAAEAQVIVEKSLAADAIAYQKHHELKATLQLTADKATKEGALLAAAKAREDEAKAIARANAKLEAAFQASIKNEKDEIKTLKLVNPELAKYKKALLGIKIAKHENVVNDKQALELIKKEDFKVVVKTRKDELKTLKLVNPELANYKQALLDIDIAKEAGHVNDEQTIDLIKEQTDLYKIEIGTLDKLDALRKGLSESAKGYLQEANNSFEQFKDLGDTVFKGLEDSIVSFVKTGKFEFKDFAAVVIEELIRIQVKSAAVKLFGDGSSGGGGSSGLLSAGLSAAANFFFPGSGALTNSVSMLPTSGVGTVAGQSIMAAAKGAVLNNGSLTPFANGGVVNSPTVFPMRNGAGLMGEAGPEAVMPLSRGSDGKLGVKSSGSQRSSQPVVINQNISVSGNGDEVLISAMQEAAKQGAEGGYAKVAKDFNRNGPLRRGI